MKNIKTERILLVFILAIGIFFRLWRLNSLPYGLDGDQIGAATNALHIFNKEPFRCFQINGLMGKPVAYLFWSLPLGSFLIALCFKVFGISQIAVSLSTAIIGILTVVTVYFLAKKLPSISMTLLTTFFFAVSPWHLLFSRCGFTHITITILLVCLSLIILLEAIEKKKISLLLWQGLVWGIILFNTYPIAFIIFPITVFYLLWRGKSEWLFSRPFFFSLLVMVSIYIFLSVGFALWNGSDDPLIVFKEGYYQFFIVRLNEARQNVTLKGNLMEGLTMLFWKMPRVFHFGVFRIFDYPLLNPLIGLAFIAGFIQSVIRRNNFDKLLIIWLVIAFFSSSTINVPQERYLISILPLPYIFSSEFIISLFKFLFKTKRLVFLKRKKFLLGAAVISLYIYFFSYQPYFVSYAGNNANLTSGLAENDLADFLLNNFPPESTTLITSIGLPSFNLYTNYRYKRQSTWHQFLNSYAHDPANIALDAEVIEETPYEGRLAKNINDGNLESYWYGDVPDGFEMFWDKPQKIKSLIISFDFRGGTRGNQEYGVEAFDDRTRKWFSLRREIHSRDDMGVVLSDLQLRTSKLRFIFYQTNDADLIQRVEEVIIIRAGENNLEERAISDLISTERTLFILALDPELDHQNYNLNGEIIDPEINFFFKDPKLKLRKIIRSRAGKSFFEIYSLEKREPTDE